MTRLPPPRRQRRRGAPPDAIVLPRRRKAARRGEILGAARALFLHEPFEQVSMARIAQAAGCVEGTLYRYFRNKRDLFDDLLVEFLSELINDIEQHVGLIDSAVERLRFLIHRHLRFAQEEPRRAALIWRQTRVQSDYFGSKLHAVNRRYVRFLTDALRYGVRRKELRAGLDDRVVRDLILGGLEHLAMNAQGRRTLDTAQLTQQLIDLLIGGLRARSRAHIDDGSLANLESRIARLERHRLRAAGASNGAASSRRRA